MTMEIIYTSAPQGLRPGTYGFCTVAATAGMPSSLIDRLEALSGYRHLFTPGTPEAARSPVVYSHLVISTPSRKLHVLSRIADAGLDYSQRSNKLAHHLLLDDPALPAAGPVWLARQPGLFETSWRGKTGSIPQGKKLPAGDRAPAVCVAWQRLTGDAGWAGVLAQQALEGLRPANLILPPDCDPLTLLEEALALVPQSRRWEVTFSTWFSRLPAGVECQWRCVLAGTPEAASVAALRGEMLLDLTRPPGAAPAGPLVEFARTGTPPADWQSASSVLPPVPVDAGGSSAAESPRRVVPVPLAPTPSEMPDDPAPSPPELRLAPPALRGESNPPPLASRRREYLEKPPQYRSGLFAYLGYALLLLVVAGASYWVGIRNTANNLVNEVAKYDTTQDKIPGSADLPQIPAAQNKNTIKATSSSGEKPPTQLDIADEPNTINGKPSDPSLKSADEPNPETDNSKNAPESDAAKNNPETKTKPENIETIKKPDRTNSSQPGTPEKQSETPRPHKLSLCATPITLYDKESESGLFSQANTIDTKKLNINAGDLAGVTIQMTDRSAVIFEKNDGNKSVSWNLVVIDGEQRTRIATLGAESESGENEISMRFEDSKISPEIIKKLDGQLFIIRSDISDRQFAYVFCRSAESLFKSSLRLKWPDLSLVETIEKESDNDLSLFIPCELMPNKFKGQPVRKSDSGRLAWDIYHPDTENLEASEEKLRIHFDLQTPTNDKTELKVEFRPRHDKDKDAATKFQNELVRYGNYDANYKSKLNAKKNGFNARQAFINLITDQAAKADQQKRLDEEIQNAKNEFNRNIEKLKPVIQRKESREAIDALFREIMPSQSKLENHGLYLSCCVYKHVRLQIEGNSILFCIPVAVFGDDKEMVLKLLNAHLCQ